MRQNQYVTLFIVSFVFWVLIFNYYAVKQSNERKRSQSVENDVKRLEDEIEGGKVEHEQIFKQVEDIVKRSGSQPSPPVASVASENDLDVKIPRDDDAIAVLLMSCDRITVARSLDQLIKYRPSQTKFPIIVSQDCGHEETAKVIQTYRHEVFHIRQPDLSDIPVPPREKKFKGYYKIARHYKWALNTVFEKFNFSTAVIVEDDLDVAPDFYEYFAATLPILRADESLWCVSAWNDNGKSEFVDKNAVDLLYRTDFFPGLGWMLTKTLWQELKTKWPKSFWDDWMREPAQRKERSCIRPELSRTKTFGKIGVSNGLFFEKHLKYIYLSERFHEFTKTNLSYLAKDNYDGNFFKIVYASPIVGHQELKSGRVFANGSVRILYNNKKTLEKIEKSIGLMDDSRGGVPRTAYGGVISFVYGKRRVFLTPSDTFKGYE